MSISVDSDLMGVFGLHTQTISEISYTRAQENEAERERERERERETHIQNQWSGACSVQSEPFGQNVVGYSVGGVPRNPAPPAPASHFNEASVADDCRTRVALHRDASERRTCCRAAGAPDGVTGHATLRAHPVDCVLVCTDPRTVPEPVNENYRMTVG